MVAECFDANVLNRQRLIWVVAIRRHLERWEPLVAAYWRDIHAGRNADRPSVWAAATEHHFVLVATHHLLVALDLPPASTVAVDPRLRTALTEGRHLHEHWPQHMPVFNVNPPRSPPVRTGKTFAARNPGRSPYWWLGFDHKDGAKLLPQASAPELHQLLDAVEAEVIASDPSLADYFPPRAP